MCDRSSLVVPGGSQAVARARLAPRLSFPFHQQAPPEISLTQGIELVFQYYQDHGIQFDTESKEPALEPEPDTTDGAGAAP